MLMLAIGFGSAAGAGAPPDERPLYPDEPLERLQYQGRARPDQAAAELERLLAKPDLPPAYLLEGLLALGVLYVDMEQVDATNAVIARVEQIGRDGNDRLQRDAAVTADRLRAGLLRNSGPLARADALLDEAERGLDGNSSVLLRIACLSTHAGIKEELGRFDEAVRLYQDAIHLSERSARWRASSLLNALAYTLFRAGQQERAWQINEDAKQRAIAGNDWMSLNEVLSVEGMLLADQGRNAESLQALKQANAYARTAGARRDEALGLGNISDYYLRQGDYKTAYATAQQALPLARAMRFSQAEQLAQLNSGLALIAMRRKDEGLPLVEEALSQYQRSDEIVSLAETLDDLGTYLEAAGYHSEALAAFRQHRERAQEAFQRNQQRALVELQESFDAERRRHERELLTDDNQLMQEALRQSELRFREWALVTAVCGMAVVLLLLVYLRTRATQRALSSNNERLKVQTEQDPLTGLANRRHLQRLAAQGDRANDARGTLYLLDLDHFKRINDHFGHAAGDAVLIEVARRLKAVVREEDLVVRWGGEEFMILVPAGQAEQTELLAQRLLAALASLPVLAGTSHIAITGSIGFASFPLQPHQLEVPWSVAIDLVDSAMYIAKTQGRNRAVGVRRLPADSLEKVEAWMKDLEAAWRDGVISLVEFHGPEGVGQTQ